MKHPEDKFLFRKDYGMLKKLILACAVAMSVLTLSADVDFGVWKNYPSEISRSSVEGVRFGLPITSSSGTVEGAELALLMAGSAEVEGLQFTLFGINFAKKIEGLQLAFINFASQQLEGLQLGFFNHANSDEGFQWGFINYCEDDATFQLGFLNFNKNGLLPVMIFLNFGSDVFD